MRHVLDVIQRSGTEEKKPHNFLAVLPIDSLAVRLVFSEASHFNTALRGSIRKVQYPLPGSPRSGTTFCPSPIGRIGLLHSAHL
jgi:hypothetical protein